VSFGGKPPPRTSAGYPPVVDRFLTRVLSGAVEASEALERSVRSGLADELRTAADELDPRATRIVQGKPRR
jgi:hypothetical protein